MQLPISKISPFYEHAIEHVSVGIHAIDVNGHTILYNAKMQEIEGYRLEEIHNRSMIELFDFTKQESILLKVLETKQPVLHKKQTYWNRDGHEVTTINDTYPLFNEDELIGAIEFARDVTSLEKLVNQPLRRYDLPLTFDMISATSTAMQQVIAHAKKAARAQMPLLLIGESGTGKDLIAEGIHHYLSPKRQQFITLFGRSTDDRMLRQLQQYLQTEDSYTFFFERIEYLTLHDQQQLLTLLKMLDETKHMAIASIGRDPIDCIGDGILLKELYYYFATVTIAIPPLRDRLEDIAAFVADYCMRHRQRYGSSIEGLTEETLALFHHYSWPGNLKELELLLDEMAAYLTDEIAITPDMLPIHFRFKLQQAGQAIQPAAFLTQTKTELLPLDDYLREAETYYVQNALKMFQGNVTKTAAALGMSRQNLQYRLRKAKK